MLANLKLRNRILLGYVFPITFLIGLGWLIYREALEREAASTKIKMFQNIIVNAQGMTNGVSKMIHNVRGRVLFPLDVSYETNYEKGYQLFRETSQVLDRDIQDPEQRQKLTIILTEFQRIDELSRRIFALVQKGDVDYAKTLTASLRFGDIEQAQEALLKREQEYLAMASLQEQTETRWLLALIAIGTTLSALMALSVGLWTASDIAKTIERVATAIAGSSMEIVATVQQQERTASQQATAVNQTTITMSELGSTSQVTAQQVESVAAEANQALQLAEGGNQTVSQTLEGMTILNTKVEAIAEQIGRLNEQAQQVGHISSLVSELANQTNMLALNAAVEAVRAGSEGKGFAVIATEIRQLADRSKTSAQKINHLVTDIQTAIRSTVVVVDEGKKTVNSGMQLTKGTTDAFSGVAEAINNIATSSHKISLAVQKQAVAVQQVGYTMKVLSQGAEETASGLSQAKASTEQLNEAAQSLKSVL